MMGQLLGTLLTATTYGNWLRGDRRGWVSDGRVLSHEPNLEQADLQRLKHAPFLFDSNRLLEVGQAIGQSLVNRHTLNIHAMTVQTWHLHLVISDTPDDLARIVKCVKDAARWHLKPGRPIWATGYDKRFCYDENSLRQRIEYVERHNVQMGWPPRPWAFIDNPFSPR